MTSQAKAVHDMMRLSAALSGSGITMPNSITSRVVDAVYSGEQNFPMMGGDWLFSLEALALVGKAMFGDNWDGAEFNAQVWLTPPVEAHKWALMQQRRNVESRKQMPPSLASNDYSRRESAEEFEARKQADLLRISNAETQQPAIVGIKQGQWEKNRAALDRLTKAAKWLGDKCRSASVKTAFTAQANMPLRDAESHIWNCTNDIGYWVRDGSVDVYVAGYATKYRRLAFVLRSDLEREIKGLAHSESNIPNTDIARLAPDLQLAVRLALKHKLFDEGMQQSNGELEKAVIAAAKEEGREIANNRIAEIVRLMRYPDKAKSAAGRRRVGK